MDPSLFEVMPGFTEEPLPPLLSRSEHFRVKFVSAQCEGEPTKSTLFSKHFNWKPVMDLVLGKLEEIYACDKLELADFQIMCWEEIYIWILSQPGFGLVACSSSRAHQEFFTAYARLLTIRWDSLFRDPCSPELIFHQLKRLFLRKFELKYSDVVPEIDVNLRPSSVPRTGRLAVRLTGAFTTDLEFHVEKINRLTSLKEISAAAVVNNFNTTGGELAALQLPVHVFPVLEYMRREQQWLDYFKNPQLSYISYIY